jgi:hypothetical protein
MVSLFVVKVLRGCDGEEDDDGENKG